MSMADCMPRFCAEKARKLLQEIYGMSAEVHPLPSERDQNFRVETEDGARFVWKIANARESRGLLEAQQQAMGAVATAGLCPRVVPAADGRTLHEVEGENGLRHLCWLIEWLPGDLFAAVPRRTPELLQDLGRALARIDLALEGFTHPALERDFPWSLDQAEPLIRATLPLIEDIELQRAVSVLLDRHRAHTAPLLPQLRRGTIYNDANDYNILVRADGGYAARHRRIAGFIDFGDMIGGYTVAEPAIAAAYAMLDREEPLAAAAAILSGYHEENPLSEAEIGAFFGLSCLRLCLSACIAVRQYRENPANDYLLISQRPIRALLPRLAAIPPRLAEVQLRHACGLPALPGGEEARTWTRPETGAYRSVLPAELSLEQALVLDLSISSPLLHGDPRENAEPALSRRIAAAMEQAGAALAVGRYDEARGLYTAKEFTVSVHPLAEARTVHLGLDLFAAADTPITAPLSGTVHAVENRDQGLDYGGVVMLRHQPAGSAPFFTLYGHLQPATIAGWRVGMEVAAGQTIGRLGAPQENGGWTPHLHLQIIRDDLGLATAFPGVCRASQRDLWKELCPDPNLIVGIPAALFPVPAPDKAHTLAERRRRIGPSLSISYRDPVKVVRGWMQYLFDDEGRRYLDVYNNVAHVGHCHPRVVQAATQQLAVLNTNTRYLHDHINRYAERLCSMLPEPLRVCFFLNSASEANELALRLARTFTGQKDTIVLEAAYHGHTSSLIDISPYKHDGPGGRGAPDWVHVAPIADGYRGRYKYDDPEAGEKYAAHVQEIIAALAQTGRSPAGFIAESCPSVGGQIFFPPHYLQNVYQAVRRAGGLCIADEVQTGFGRLGSHFWGFAMQDVTPDVVVLGKPIGNGFPLAAVVTTPRIAAAFANGMEFFSTFGGNPVACAVGWTVLDVVLGENLPAHAQRVGERILAGLRPLRERYELVGDVRGHGLFLGMELVRDRRTLEPAVDEAAHIVNRLRERGILLGTDGPLHNVVKIRPPMPFDLENADLLVDEITRIFREDFGA